MPFQIDDVIAPIDHHTSRSIQCWLYLIRNFPDRLLSKKMLSSYHNTAEQPYNEKSVRTVPARDDLSY